MVEDRKGKGNALYWIAELDLEITRLLCPGERRTVEGRTAPWTKWKRERME
jgi:hypothetical protein